MLRITCVIPESSLEELSDIDNIEIETQESFESTEEESAEDEE